MNPTNEHREQAREIIALWRDNLDKADSRLPSLLIAAISERLSSRDAEVREACADLVPTNWLDSLLSGPDAVIGKPPYDCCHIEALLRAIKERVRTAPLQSENPPDTLRE